MLATLQAMRARNFPTETLMAVSFEHRLSAPQAWLLCESRRAGGKVTTRELKNELFSRAILSYSARRLEEKGLAKLRSVERQSLEITLTAKGKKLAEQLA
jgi:DNA-binding MarR family transcriptional regulator